MLDISGDGEASCSDKLIKFIKLHHRAGNLCGLQRHINGTILNKKRNGTNILKT